MEKRLRILLTMLCLALLGMASCKVKDPEGQEKNAPFAMTEAYARTEGAAYLEDLLEGRYEDAYGNHPHDSAMTKAVGPERYEEIFIQVIQTYGEFVGYTGEEISEKGDYTIYTRGLAFRTASLNANVVFDKKGLISGFNFTPHTFEAQDDAPLPQGLREEEKTFGLEGFPLQARITLPEGEGPFPAVVLVHGSGPNDMDETIGPNKPFRDLAWSLGQKGIAVFRYDKRTYTHGQAVAQDKGFTVQGETIDDAAEAVRFVSSLPEVDGSRIFVLGHSLGAHLVPRIAEAAPEAAGFMMAAGMLTSLPELFPYQVEYLAMLDGTLSPEEAENLDRTRELAEKARYPERIGADESVLGAYKAYWEDLAAYDPLGMAKAMVKPVLVLHGERDYQVPLKEYEIMREALEEKENYSFRLYPGVNHLLMEGEGIPSPAEYQVKNQVHPPLVEDVAEFIKGNQR
ncbi:alpha/beta fold hydrolase [Anaerotalea alkaliphila]|uniref:Alpha/beta fold hydrolase n=1 Tax=Anaerotalea alkaliphila TaxID=2662126 RepID=A0A7X5KM20_9FIRM|nr:alpha/beta fold hydrolase [Anaerotalea alkaliphila]NDL67471.1 alpha/beta fold hydrolase [Anaerotalea alkaliphila]